MRVCVLIFVLLGEWLAHYIAQPRHVGIFSDTLYCSFSHAVSLYGEKSVLLDFLLLTCSPLSSFVYCLHSALCHQ